MLTSDGLRPGLMSIATSWHKSTVNRAYLRALHREPNLIFPNLLLKRGFPSKTWIWFALPKSRLRRNVLRSNALHFVHQHKDRGNEISCRTRFSLHCNVDAVI
jgi:hypothetical protein